MTIKSLFSFFVRTNFAAALPDLFIKVSGNATSILALPILPSLTSALDFLLSSKSLNSCFFAKYDAVSRPILWRVPSYSFPGFPSPMIVIIDYLYPFLAQSAKKAYNLPMEESSIVAEEKKPNGFWEFLKAVIISILIVIPVRAYVAQPFIVDGASMEPTFRGGDYLIIDELSFQFRAPERGEVIVFRYPQDPSQRYIKRIIGLPGETLRIQGGQVFVFRDGAAQALDELAYLAQFVSTSGD